MPKIKLSLCHYSVVGPVNMTFTQKVLKQLRFALECRSGWMHDIIVHPASPRHTTGEVVIYFEAHFTTASNLIFGHCKASGSQQWQGL